MTPAQGTAERRDIPPGHPCSTLGTEAEGHPAHPGYTQHHCSRTLLPSGPARAVCRSPGLCPWGLPWVAGLLPPRIL